MIQSLGPGELLNLEPDSSPEYVNQSLEDIAETVMGVEVPQRSRRFLEMTAAAELYFRLLRQGESQEAIDQAEQKLNELSERYSDDPAFVALLRVEREAARSRETDASR
ncbi:MAG: hypothetical protein H7834_10020 [Magnetococcus sp. YQC-9]